MLITQVQKKYCFLLSSKYSSLQKVAFLSGCCNADIEVFSILSVKHETPILFHILKDLNSGNYSLVKEFHDEIYKKLNSFLYAVDNIGAIFSNKRIDIVVLKNGGIARGIYPCPGCCPMGDIDVLIEKKNFSQAHQLLLENGYTFEYRSPLEEAELEAAEASGGAEYWKVLPDGENFWLELQWRPVAGRWIRPDQEPRAEDLIARSLPIPGTAVRLLSPEDNLLQVALHTAKHSYVRAPGFRLHLDVDRIVNYQEIDWDLFLDRVVCLGVKTPVYFSLLIPKELFETPIPDFVLSRLRPPTWKEKAIVSWLNKAGLFNPDEKKFGRIGYVLFTALLYDRPIDLFRVAFPDVSWLKKRYSVKNNFFLPYFYFHHLYTLLFRRLST
jgi:hypothetical protein